MSSTKGNLADDAVPGELIRGRYRLEQKLAKGGMGTVYRGCDTSLNRPVAVKILHAVDDGDDPEHLVERFKREAEALAQLNHRNIVTVFDYGPTEQGGYFLAMEFVDGPSLAQVAKSDDLDPQRTVRLVMQIAQALRYAHKQGIVHRDIKAGNVLVARTEDGEVAKLVDFGLVRLQKDERLTAHGLILGSVHCMAPEQIKGGEIDARTDIYALGVVTFRLLTGQYPFHSAHPTEVMAAHLHAPVPRFRDVRPELVVPPGLEGVVRKCLAKSPDERYQSAGDLARDLRECLDVPPSEFISVTLIEDSEMARQLQAPRSNRTAVVALLSLFGVALLGGGAVIAAGGLYAGAGDEVLANVSTPEPKPGAVAVEAATDPVPSAVAAVETPPAQVEEEPEPEPEPAPEPAPDGPTPAPAPAPVVAKPAPKPPPKPVAPAPEPVAAVAAVAAVEVAPKPAPAPAAAVLLKDVVVAKGADQVTVTLKMSNNSVRPLKYEAEGADARFQKQYHVTFRGGASSLGKSKVDVGTDLVDSVSLVESGGALLVVVNSRTSPRMEFSGSGPDYVVTVKP